jgi:hypothetical protein
MQVVCLDVAAAAGIPGAVAMDRVRSIELDCPECRGAQFEASLLKEESIGVVKCLQCSRDYLLLDSADYWFDTIQQRPYPKPTRCGCKATAFRLRLDYVFRDDGDVRSVVLWRSCAACEKTRRLLDVEIDYSPTKELVAAPLVYCKNPKIHYDLHELTSIAKPADIARLIVFLGEQGGCRYTACLRESGDWCVRDVDAGEAAQAVVREGESPLTFFWIYASPHPIRVSADAIRGAKKEAVFWKRHAIIRISAPIRMAYETTRDRPALLYYFRFSNEYVQDEVVAAKSRPFVDLTALLVKWLGTEFVTWRGANCFDNEEEHLRAFGDRFRSAAGKKPRRK